MGWMGRLSSFPAELPVRRMEILRLRRIMNESSRTLGDELIEESYAHFSRASQQ